MVWPDQGLNPQSTAHQTSMLTITPLMWLIWGLKLAAKLNRAIQNCLKAIAGSQILHKIFFTFFLTTKLKLARYYSCIFANVSISLTLLIRIWNFLRVWYTKCIIMLFSIIYYQDFDYWHKLKHHFDTQTMFLQLFTIIIYLFVQSNSILTSFFRQKHHTSTKIMSIQFDV